MINMFIKLDAMLYVHNITDPHADEYCRFGGIPDNTIINNDAWYMKPGHAGGTRHRSKACKNR